MANDLKHLLRINRQNKTPLYHQIVENLRELIQTGQIVAGEMIPSEWDLSETYGVSRLTVRRAMDDLVRDGLLIRKHGVGTFVGHTSVAQIYPSELSFTRNMEQIGRNPASKIISLGALPAAPEIALRLGIETGDPVFELVRVRLADDQPLILETTYISAARFPGLAGADLAGGSLYSFLSAYYQVDITALDHVLEPTLLTDREAALLEVDPGEPAILSEMVGRTAEGAPVEYTWSLTCRGRGRVQFYLRGGDIGKRHFGESAISKIKRE
ncbi:MAG: GntR family transcriptional regulator [Chloroflexota bacterium]